MKARGVISLIVLVYAFGVTAAKPDEQPTEETKSNKVVCKKVKVTGTHFKKRVCQKQSAWKRMEREAQRVMKGLETGTAASTTD